MTKKILVPLTKSTLSHKILAEVEKFVSPDDSQIILFYVHKPPKGSGFAIPDYRSDYALEPAGEPVGPKAHPVFPSQEEDSMQSEAEVTLLPLTNHLQEKGYNVSTQYCFVDEVVDEIVRVVERDKIDMIAMSTQARVGILRFFFADIADRVTQKVDIPVLLIYPKK
jgi:nucleotide-binding universal stress UspA family protein